MHFGIPFCIEQEKCAHLLKMQNLRLKNGVNRKKFKIIKKRPIY